MLIAKIGWSRIPELKDVIHQNIEPLGVESIELGQLCLGCELTEDFANEGDCYHVFDPYHMIPMVEFGLEIPKERSPLTIWGIGARFRDESEKGKCRCALYKHRKVLGLSCCQKLNSTTKSLSIYTIFREGNILIKSIVVRSFIFTNFVYEDLACSSPK